MILNNFKSLKTLEINVFNMVNMMDFTKVVEEDSCLNLIVHSHNNTFKNHKINFNR